MIENMNDRQVEGEIEIDVRKLGIVLWRWGWLLLLVSVLLASVAYVVCRMIAPTYEATTKLLINEAPSVAAVDYNSTLLSERMAGTYADIFTTRPLLSQVIKDLNLPITVDDLVTKVTVMSVSGKQIINVSVQDKNQRVAENIANTLVTVFVRQTQQLQDSRYAASKESLTKQMDAVNQHIEQTQAQISNLGANPDDRPLRDTLSNELGQYRQSYSGLLQSFENVRLAEAQATLNIVQLEPAMALPQPVFPHTLLYTVLAFLAGLLGTATILLVLEITNDIVKDPEVLSKRLGLPILGLIGQFDAEVTPLIVATKPRSPISEAFRGLRTNIEYTAVDQQLSRLLITSASPGEGKSSMACNLGVVFAQNGSRVALVEMDLRRPTLHTKLDRPNQMGMSHLFVQQNLDLDGVLQDTGIEGLSLITVGDHPPNPSELLGSKKMGEILTSLQAHVDIIIADAPPVLPVADAVILAKSMDGVLIVVRLGVTKLAAIKRAVDQLRFVNANTIGIIVNGIPARSSRYSYGYDYYSHYSSDGDSQDGKNVVRRRRFRWPSFEPKQDRQDGSLEL